jgi:hypothetical protein
MRLKNKHQVFMSTVVSANMIYRYKNWQITTRLKQVVKGRHWYGEIKDLYKEDMYHYLNIFMAHCKSSFKGKAYNRKQRRKLNISKDLPF